MVGRWDSCSRWMYAGRRRRLAVSGFNLRVHVITNGWMDG